MYSCIPVNAFIVVLETAEINRKISFFTLFLFIQFFLYFFSVNFTVADSVEFVRVIPLSSEVEHVLCNFLLSGRREILAIG